MLEEVIPLAVALVSTLLTWPVFTRAISMPHGEYEAPAVAGLSKGLFFGGVAYVLASLAMGSFHWFVLPPFAIAIYSCSVLAKPTRVA